MRSVTSRSTGITNGELTGVSRYLRPSSHPQNISARLIAPSPSPPPAPLSVDHVRTILATKPMKENARIVIAFFQIRVARRKLLERCRATFRRFYDSKARNYFYYREDTFETTWHKPYCLKKEELIPLPTPDFAARKIQGESAFCKSFNLFHTLHLSPATALSPSHGSFTWPNASSIRHVPVLSRAALGPVPLYSIV